MEETSSSWSDLPQCLAELILKHLSVPNCLSFGSVCRSWCQAQKQCPHRLGPPFIVFYRSAAAARGIIEILSLPDQRIYKIPVPGLNLPFSCVSSSHGWMLLQTINSCILVKNNECVNLPTGSRYLDCLFFSNPSDPDGILFVRNSTNIKFLLYQRCDDRFDEYHWNGTAVSNTIFHEGKLYTLSLKRENKRKFHALNDDDWSPDDEYLSLMVVDPLFPHACNTTTMKMKLEVLNSTQLRSTLVMYHAFVLVESCGEILMVRIMENDVSSLSCDVFQADFIKMEWINVENLGDRILFSSQGGSVSICASEMGCKGNRIYYIPNTFERSKRVYMELDGTNGSYMEFKLGRDGVTIHSIPVKGNDCVIVDAWLTPCNP